MSEYDEYEIINYISAVSGKDRDDIMKLINKKVGDLDNLITTIAGAFMVAKDLEIDIDKDDFGVQMSMAGIRRTHRVEEYITERSELLFALGKLDDHEFKKLSVECKDNIIKMMSELNKIMRSKK